VPWPEPRTRPEPRSTAACCRRDPDRIADAVLARARERGIDHREAALAAFRDVTAHLARTTASTTGDA